MIHKLRNVDSVYLVFMGLIPVFFYIHGFLISGNQIFNLDSQDQISSIQTPTNIESQVAPIPADIIIDEKDKRLEVLDKSKEEKKAYKQAVTLSEKMMTVKDVQLQNMAINDDSPVITSQKKIEKEMQVQKQELTAHKRKNKLQIVNSILEGKRDKAQKDDDPYVSFNLERSGSLLHKTEKKVSESKPKKLDKNLIYVDAQFIGDKRFTVGQDNFIYLRNTTSFLVKDREIPKGTVMLGNVSVEEKVYISISTIKLVADEIPINIVVCDNNGTEGIIFKDIDESFQKANSELEDIIDGSLDNINVSIPMVGSVSLPSRLRKDKKKEIFFNSSTKIKLLVK
ncbi:conjugative transposon protein TraM [Chondrinema litorale]|uniref:conjugative transposon protein TraM n=1 Tax=Chondrinema litorale TaxID=2994555 RepID=UPI002542ACF9|nr:conjugative transposon protein TraM [Chondrinema litorale]UZR98991.1 conjugative transposon protein TraM [Chondrinema litorale]